MDIKKMRIWFISDTHGTHRQLIIPKDIDLVIHTGDATNFYNEYGNMVEYYDFKNWYYNLPIAHKIYVPGNHDSFIYKNENQVKKDFKELGIHLLVNELIEINGIKIYGSPMTPTFGNWYYMTDSAKINKYWQQIPENIDILATHGPPKRVLDLSYSRLRELEFCGDGALFSKVIELQPKIHCFGHIHNSKECINQGERVYKNINFINASCVTDGKMGIISSNGIIKEI